ncbi:MAG: dihydroorotase [Sulfurimonas sp.]|nr:MAG: dihydroorotase [Sulfurimonas sp.]
MIIADVILCDSNGERPCDVEVIDGKITRMASHLEGDERTSYAGSYLLPGLVDTNVELLDGHLNSNNLDKIAQMALKGGVGTVVLMPNSTPAVDNEIVLEFLQKHRKQKLGANIETTVAATKEDETLSNIAIMLKKGALAPYMTTAISNNLACRIAEYVKMYNATLFCKAQDSSLSSVGVMVEGKMATKLGLVGIPPLGESVHVARMIEIARHYDIDIVFKSIASPRSIEMISNAKEEGVKVYCEVGLHHLLVSDAACEGFNTTAKLNPPLQQHEDMLRLQEFLKAGHIDMLSVLHQPASPVNKDVAFFDAQYGSEAIEEALSLYYSKLVCHGMISMQDLVRLCVTNPARSIGRVKGVIAEGENINAVVFDPNDVLHVKNRLSLYHGEMLRGRVVAVFKNSRVMRF